MPTPPFEIDVAEQIWGSRYRYRDGAQAQDQCVADSWQRVAQALAAVEPADQAQWQQRFYGLLQGFRFLPAGRILAGAGAAHDVTLFNCFVMGPIGDSMAAIFDALKQGAITMQQGGGVGYDFSTLRPAGASAWRVGGVASGPVSFMRIWDSMCDTLLSTAARRGAMMGTLRCDHPDIEDFVEAKRDPGALRNFNLSVLVSDAFMQAVELGADWPLLFPAAGLSQAERERYPERLQRDLGSGPLECLVYRHISARGLWERIMRANYDTAEPGVLFIDRINGLNNLAYRERISATNPCGEIPLPPYGACNLGSINLTCFVQSPFSSDAVLDLARIEETARLAVRLLDNVIDASRFPLPAQEEQARGSRRIGLGITGLADSLIMLGLHYGSAEARHLVQSLMRTICHSAYRASIELAGEKGAFPFFARDAYLDRPFIQALPQDIRDGIAAQGLRNSHLIAIAPTGTISLYANNISSGIEPVYDFSYRRRIRDADGCYRSHELADYALRRWREAFGDKPLPESFVNAAALPPLEHLRMQAVLQPYVDNAISKTIQVPETIGFEDFKSLYQQAYKFGLKGCTTYRANPIRGAVLSPGKEAGPTVQPDARCCGLDREMD